VTAGPIGPPDAGPTDPGSQPLPAPEPATAPQPGPATAPAPETGANGGPVGIVQSALSGAAKELGKVVQPAAAAALASTFTFPLALMVAVLLFVVCQSRLDQRDPKLRMAPRSIADTLVGFEEEGNL
jgi:hypothetical protein